MIETDDRMSSEMRVYERENKVRQRKAYDVQAPNYIRMDIADILEMGMISNHVLVRVPRSDTEYIEVEDRDGFALQVAIKFAENEWAPTYVEVVTLPSALRLERIGDQRVDFEQHSIMEIKPSDRAIVRYLAITQALGLADSKGENRSVMDAATGDLYAMIHYRDFVLRFRGPEVELREGKALYDRESVEVYPLNGWVLLEPVEDAAMKAHRIFEHLSKRESKLHARVRATGARVEWQDPHFAPDLGEVHEGDLVALQKGGHIQLQNAGNEVLGERLFRCPIRHILHKLEVDGRPMTDEELYAIHKS